MNKMKLYEKVKPTKNPYLKSIPEHWIECKLSHIAKNRVVRYMESEQLLSVYLGYGVMKYADTVKTQVHKPSEDLSAYKYVEVGNLVLNNQQAWRGSIGVSPYSGIVSPVYYVLELSSIFNHRFANYLFRNHSLVDQYVISSKGVGSIQRNLYYPYLKNIFVSFPPKEEQDQIVRYLDSKLVKINKFIKNKKRLIALLKEQKQAVINQAVTKGLDPEAKMKPSGVEWVGDVPDGWAIKKLRQYLRPFSSKNRADLQLLSVVRELGVIVRDVENYEENHNYIPDDLSGYKVVKVGQFVMNKMKAWQGSYGVSDHTGIVSPAYYVFDIIFKNTKFFHHAIRSKLYVNFFAQASDGIRTGQWDLSLQKMKNIPFLEPPSRMQQMIVDYIPMKLNIIDQTIDRIKKEIDLITEYRTSLISAVVTGKVDVRGIEVDELPAEELSELEPADLADEQPEEDEILQSEVG
jgi:type I restriction enzyme, S subunit